MIKLSIIIPCYNAEPYIYELLHTLAPQITKEVEVILIDDGSTDGSAEICKQYCDKYPNIVYKYQENLSVQK